jgi:hypothetical protein
VPKNDGKPWTRERVKALREQTRDRNVSTDEIAKNLARTVAAQLALTVLAGVTIASGFRAKNPEPGSSLPVSEGFDPET